MGHFRPRHTLLLGLVLATCATEAPRAYADVVLTAHVVNGSLIVRGSDDDDYVSIQSGPEPGSLVVSPFDGDGTVNGVPGAATFSGITGDVRVDTGEGADWVAFEEAFLPGNLTVHLGHRDDFCEFYASEVAGRTRIYGGRDPDLVVPFQSRFHGDVRVDTGAEMDTFQPEESIFDGSLVVNLGAGDDEAVFVETSAQAVSVRTGRGDDYVIVEESTFAAPAVFNGGPGYDYYESFPPTVFGAGRTLLSLEAQFENP